MRSFGAADAHDAHGYWSRLTLVLLVLLGLHQIKAHGNLQLHDS